MPVKSKKQSRYLNMKFGHDWVKRHHFDNSTKGLPQRVEQEGLPLTARQMFERARLEERDDLDDKSRVNVPRETKDYARMSSSDVMEQPGGTAKKWFKSLKLRAKLTGEDPNGKFANRDDGRDTTGKKLKESERVVEELLWRVG